MYYYTALFKIYVVTAMTSCLKPFSKYSACARDYVWDTFYSEKNSWFGVIANLRNSSHITLESLSRHVTVPFCHSILLHQKSTTEAQCPCPTPKTCFLRSHVKETLSCDYTRNVFFVMTSSYWYLWLVLSLKCQSITVKPYWIQYSCTLWLCQLKYSKPFKK